MDSTTEDGSNKVPANNEPSIAPSNEDAPNNNGRNQKRKHGGRGGGLQFGSRSKKKDMGRGDYFRSQPDKRQRNEEARAKRQKLEEEGKATHLPTPFSAEEIAAEERRPKKKVAVMIGYSGTGYKGMQMTPGERTIEGDLFKAFVAAGVISKANADDPKKSSFVRCARTDKGVHAAGNVISLKMIVDEENAVEKINSHLSPQIRVWGIQRTTGSFSCYQACDSRYYEYMIPSYCFLPPHPSSYLGKKLVDLGEKFGERGAYDSRQSDVATFWSEIDEQSIKPILASVSSSVRQRIEKSLFDIDSEVMPSTEDASTEAGMEGIVTTNDEGQAVQSEEEKKEFDDAIRRCRAAYMTAKKSYRISQDRLQRVKDVLAEYVGTRNYHNYTIKKTFKDPSAKRLIRSFKVAGDPVLINGTEWLSLKVHGQSFMMHQIRKMVGMAALVVRCGTPIDRIQQSFQNVELAIPKVPGLGLLLEHPVFESYNKKAAEQFGRETIDFDKYEKEIEDFKRREIYQRIYSEEESSIAFHSFFAHIDNYKEPHFLWVTAGGVEAGNYRKEGGESKAPAPGFEADDASGGEDEGN